VTVSLDNASQPTRRAAPRRHFSPLEIVAVLAIFTLAFILRFGWGGVSSFAGDEARISLDALRLTRGGEFVYIAQQSSTGIPFLPASVWMFAPPYLLSPDPQVATWYVSLLSLLTVIGVWALARRWGGAWAGLTAALFIAASPYAVFYGRSIWQPNLLPPLALLWAWAALPPPPAATASLLRREGESNVGTQRAVSASGSPLALRERGLGGEGFIALHCFLGGFVWQVHFAGLALALGTALLFVYGRWWRRWRAVLLGGGLAALCTLPYVYYLLTQAPQVLEQFGQVGGAGAQIDLSALGNLLRLALGYDWGYLALGDYDTFSRDGLAPVLAGGLLLAGVLGFGSQFSVLGSGFKKRIAGTPRNTLERENSRLRTENPEPRTSNSSLITHYSLLLIWLFCSPLFFLRHTTPVLPHYQLVALPAVALLAGWATTLLPHRVWRIGVTAAVALLATVWAAQIAASLNRAAIDRPPQSALSSILNESRDAAAGLPTDRAALFFTHGDDAAISGEVAVFGVLLWGHPDARILNGEATLILPDAPATLMTTLAPFQAWEELLVSGLVNDMREYPRRAPVLPFVSTDYDGITAPQGFTMITPVPLADGATLLGWRARQVGDRFRISTLWRIEDLPPPATLQQFHHLYRADSAVPDFVTDVPLSVHQWRVGDTVIVMGDYMGVPAGGYRLVVGHYTLPDVARVSRMNSGDGAIELGEVEF
jgi:hypothetical protein